MRKEGKSVKRWWFNSRAKQLVQELYPVDEYFKFSDGWFNRFCKRKAISLRRKTQKSQKPPSDLRKSIENFHGERGELIH